MKDFAYLGKFYHSIRHILFIVFCLFSLFYPVAGQAHIPISKIDSMKYLLGDKYGKEEVDLLIDISKAKWAVSLEKSLSYATQALQLAEELNYPGGQADALNRIGNVHYYLRNKTDAHKNYRKALIIAQSMEDHKKMGVYFNNIGLLYKELKQYDSSEFYLIKALNAKEVSGEKDLIASTLNSLGLLYRDKKQYNLAIVYLFRQLNMQKETANDSILASIHTQIGEIYYQQKRYNESMEQFMSALNYFTEISDSVNIVKVQHHLVRSYLANEELALALEKLNYSMDIAIAISSQDLIRDNYQIRYLYHKQKDSHKTALYYLVKHSNLKDSLKKIETARQFEQLERIFEIEKQNNKIELLHKENQIQEMLLNRQFTLRSLLIILLIFLIAFKAIFIYRFRLIQKTNTKLKHKILELEKTNDKLRLSAKSLEQLNSTKNRFFSIIAHDLKNPFNSLLGFSEMITSNFNQLSEEEIREYISILHQSSQNLYKLLENLLKWSDAQTGIMHFFPEQFDLVSLIHSEIHFIRISAMKKQITIIENMPDKLIINSDKLLLSSVIRNLLDNALKFTHKSGNIKISAKKEIQHVFVEISDSGIGIPENIKEKLFRLDGNISRKGTNNEEGGGLGLILCKELIEKAGGNIGIKSEQRKGSRFWFTLPYKGTA